MSDAEPVLLSRLVEYLDSLLDIPAFPDYSRAVNGLQVEGPQRITRVAAAVDAAEYSVDGAVTAGADLLLVHHGLFWANPSPLTGRMYRRIAPLMRHNVAVYSAHLPLDAHPELGNCIRLARLLDLDPYARFASYEGRDIGYLARTDEELDAFRARVRAHLGEPVEVIRGGPGRVREVAVLTGSGAGFVEEAVRLGADTLLTGEAAHHTVVDARELGLNVVLAGHYRTETLGVQALAAHLEEAFGLPWTFLDHPSSL